MLKFTFRGENLETEKNVKKFTAHLQLLSRRHDTCCCSEFNYPSAFLRVSLAPAASVASSCSISVWWMSLKATLLRHCGYPTSLFNDDVSAVQYLAVILE